MNPGNRSFLVLSKKQDQKHLGLEELIEHHPTVELLLGCWRGACFQEELRLSPDDSGDVAQQAKFVPRLH